MKKKILAILFVVLIITSVVSVAMAVEIGEPMGKVYYSAIDTYINNYPISAYNMDGRQVICAEDLSEYGFDVVYNNDQRALYIEPNYSVTTVEEKTDVKKYFYLQYKLAYEIVYSDIKVYLKGNEIESFNVNGKCMIKIRDLEVLGSCEYNFEENYSKAWIDGLPKTEYKPLEIDYQKKLTVVLDPGHGKSSWTMSEEEKTQEGYFKKNGVWGEWRHWKNGTANEECNGFGCRGDRSCWYPMSSGDRTTEPTINLNNAMSAKKYLEELGYNVRMTRYSDNQNPSFSKRISYCYPNNDRNDIPDVSCYVCIHSNAGGGRGSAYIAAEGRYMQKWVNSGFAQESNTLGQKINNRIVSETSMSRHGGGKISGLGYMILFNKCPVPAGYLEIGFFDSSADRSILNSEYDKIGKAIAYGINDYIKGW